MPRLEALIFDVDGTLADTERDGHRVAFNEAFAELGLDWHWSVGLYGRLLGVTGGKERIRYFLEHFLTDFEAPADLDGFIAELHRRKTERYSALLRAGRIRLRPGVERLLREARKAGLKLAVATTTTPSNVVALLEANLGPESVGWFSVIAAGDVVPAKKPAPDVYHYALRRLGLPAERCLAFEDSDNGLRAARAAGLRTVITVNDYTRGQAFSGAALVLDHLGEPDRPFRVLAGEAGGARLLDVAALQRLFG